jgi:hypothetical protein
MELEEKIEGGGKKALAHRRAIQMVVRGYGDKDIEISTLWGLFWLQRASMP